MFDVVEANYDQLEQLAGQFTAQSQAMQEMLQKVRNSLGPLEDGGWMGQGSKAFFEAMQSEVLPAALRLQQALEEGSRVTNDISQTIQQAEDEASNRFRVN